MTHSTPATATGWSTTLPFGSSPQLTSFSASSHHASVASVLLSSCSKVTIDPLGHQADPDFREYGKTLFDTRDLCVYGFTVSTPCS